MGRRGGVEEGPEGMGQAGGMLYVGNIPGHGAVHIRGGGGGRVSPFPVGGKHGATGRGGRGGTATSKGGERDEGGRRGA